MEALKEYLTYILCKLPITKSHHQHYTMDNVDEKVIFSNMAKFTGEQALRITAYMLFSFGLVPFLPLRTRRYLAQ